MKLLIENWREYLKESRERALLFERINSLSSRKRFVNDTLTEIVDDDPRRTIPISDDELNKIKKATDLEGTPDFLGAGSQGQAWQFDNKVLKLTADSSEAHAAYLISGEDHPNVYKIDLVARRDDEDRDNTLKHVSYIIVYELLDYPNNAMVDVAELMFHKVKKNNIYYFWEEDYLERAEEIIRQLVKYIDRHPESLEDAEPTKGSYIIPKLESLSEQLALDEKETKLLIIFWTLLRGAYNDTLDSQLNVLEHARKTLGSPKIRYLDQLAGALTWLNERGVRFTDIKTSNIMEKEDEAAIIDIGYSSVREKKPIPTLEEFINEKLETDNNKEE